MATKIFTKQYQAIFSRIFDTRSHFVRSFGGNVQTFDGVSDSENMMYVKTNTTEAVLKTYSTDANTAFGTGTGSTNRFGQRTEIKSIDTAVPYEQPISIHEGVDNVTVNDVPDQVIAERFELNALATTEYINGLLGKAISDNASETLTGALSEDGVTKLFADAHKKFVNNKIKTDITWVAYVNTDVYNFLIDSKLATTAKQSSANIDEQTLYKFKGFLLAETPDEYFQTGEQAYFVADNVGVVGLGFSIIRTIDSEDFYGVAIQGASKYGKYIPDANKKAIIKAKLAPAV